MEVGKTSAKKSAEEESMIPTKDVPYREAIGSTMHLMVGTRPDISYAVGNLSQHCENHLLTHWTSIKRALRYIHGSHDHGILFDGALGFEQLGYSDSDWAGCLESRKSMRGYVFTIAAGAVSWRSKQKIVATSSCEAEYIASCHAAKRGCLALPNFLQTF